MQWTELFFRHRASCWKTLAAESSDFVYPMMLTAPVTGSQTHSNLNFATARTRLLRTQTRGMWNRMANKLLHGSAPLKPSLGRAASPSQGPARRRAHRVPCLLCNMQLTPLRVPQYSSAMISCQNRFGNSLQMSRC